MVPAAQQTVVDDFPIRLYRHRSRGAGMERMRAGRPDDWTSAAARHHCLQGVEEQRKTCPFSAQALCDSARTENTSRRGVETGEANQIAVDDGNQTSR